MLKFSVLSTNKLRYHELSPGQPRGRLKTAPSNIEYPNSHKAAVVDSAANSPRPNFQLLYKKPHQSGSTSAHVGRGSSSQLCDQKIGKKTFLLEMELKSADYSPVATNEEQSAKTERSWSWKGRTCYFIVSLICNLDFPHSSI